MNIKKVILGASVIYITFKAGVLIGHIECLRNLANKYGKDIFDKDGKLTDQVTKKFSITKFFKEQSVKGA